MVHQELHQQPDSTIPTDNSLESTEQLASDDNEQPTQQEPSSNSTESSSIKGKATSPPPQQEELGKNFAARKIQMATIAIRSSHSASQSPLFPKPDMFQQIYQRPFVASSLSTPTAPFTSTTQHNNDMPRSLPPHLLPSSSSTTGRALLDKTWSMLASNLESNQQQRRKKPGRRVTFKKEVEYFPLDSSPSPPSSDTTTETANLDDYQEDIEKNTLPSIPRIVNHWDEPYTGSSNESSSTALRATDIPKQIDSYSTPPSVTSSTSSTSSSSLTTLTLSSPSSQSNSIINSNGNDMTASYDRPSPFSDQQINTSTSSLPAYNPLSSSTVSLTLSTSSSPTNTQSSSQIALQRKGNSISRTAILEILSSRTPSGHHRFTPNNHKRSSNHNSKQLSLLQQTPRHQVPIDFHHTLDSVQNEIKEAIQRAKASNAGNSTTPAPESSIDSSPTNDNQSRNAHTVDLETKDTTIADGGDNNSYADSEQTDTKKDNNCVDSEEMDTSEDTNQQQSSGDSVDMDQLYLEEDSDSNTVHGENNSSETIYDDATNDRNGNENNNGSSHHGIAAADKPHIISISTKQPSPRSPALDSNCDSSNSGESIDENINETESNNAPNPLLVFLPSPEQQASDFGDTLRNEIDRITGDMTPIIVSTPDMVATVTMEDNEPKSNASTIGMTPDDQPHKNDIKQHRNSSIAWQVLGYQDENNAPIKGHSPGNNQSENTIKNGRLYIKVIAAENLDFPINQNAPSIQCSVNDGNHYLGSGHYKMQHNIQFNHEFMLDNIKPDTEFTLTLHAIRPEDQHAGTSPTKRWSKRSSFGNGGGGGAGNYRADDLSRYINIQDGALAQTRVPLSAVSYQCRTRVCTASLALVNGWYQPAKKSGNRYPLLLSRATKEKRHVTVQEKAVGKLTIELFYLPNAEIKKITDLPVDMDSCENALNIQRFHQTVWISGYMSQLGGDVKYWRRRYFKLIGGQLYSYTDTLYSPRTMIDLSKAVTVASDNRIVMETNNIRKDRQQQPNQYEDNLGVFDNDGRHNLLMALESQSNVNAVERDQSPHKLAPHNNNSGDMTKDNSSHELSVFVGGGPSATGHMVTGNNDGGELRKSISGGGGGGDDDDLSSYSVKNSFQLKFENGEMIEFFCDSAHERERWLHILKVILGRIPTLPSWLSV